MAEKIQALFTRIKLPEGHKFNPRVESTNGITKTIDSDIDNEKISL